MFLKVLGFQKQELSHQSSIGFSFKGEFGKTRETSKVVRVVLGITTLY